MLGIIGKKIGISQLFEEDGTLTPVTVVQVEPNTIIGKRTKEKNGYSAVVLGAVKAKKNSVTKPVLGQFGKDIEPVRVIKEFRETNDEFVEWKPGDKKGAEIFEGINYVDIRGISKGKGFQGVMKRHGFSGGNKTHGSKFHRANGSTGMAAWPSRVLKGTKMAGRMGNEKVCVQNLKVVRLDVEKGLIIIKGSIPGNKHCVVFITKSKKKS